MASSVKTDPYVMNLLAKTLNGKRMLSLQKGETFFSQGDRSDAIFFIQGGHVKVSVVSGSGKEAVIAMLGPHDFFGEGCLVGQSLRMNTVTTLEGTTVFRVEKSAMVRALQSQPELAKTFMSALMSRNITTEEDLCAQLLNDSEKRLARVLLKLDRLRDHDVMIDDTLPFLSHETMAEMVGTTRSRVTHFMNKFRKQGLIDYDNSGFTVRTDKLNDMVLHN